MAITGYVDIAVSAFEEETAEYTGMTQSSQRFITSVCSVKILCEPCGLISIVTFSCGREPGDKFYMPVSRGSAASSGSQHRREVQGPRP